MNRLTATLTVVIVFVTTRAPGQDYGWTVIARPDPLYALNTVCFVDSIHGWCAGHLRIYRTTDGGATWEAGSQPYLAASFFDLSFSDTLRGWAVGSLDNASAMIWRTTDGGFSWSDQTGYMDRRKYFAVVAFSASKGIAVGRTDNFFPNVGKIIQTTNGGTAWLERSIADSNAGLDAAFFLDSLHGWAPSGVTNGGPVILRTNDGGNSWQPFISQGQHQLFFIDTLQGWGAHGWVYRTRDGGSTWLPLSFVSDSLWGELSITALSFLDSLNGRAFGGISFHGIISEGIFRTPDGGLNWFRESIGLTGDFGGVNDAMMLDANHGWAVCNDGSVLRYHLITGAGEPQKSFLTFSLRQNYPNPFNPTTTIGYEIARRCHVSLFIYDALGRKIQRLVSEEQGPGVYHVVFDGSKLPSGAYYCRMTAGEFTQTNEMLLVK